MEAAGVVNEIWWHILQPTFWNCTKPLAVEVVGATGVGGCRKRMKSEKRSRSPGKFTGALGASPVSLRSSGTPLVLLVPAGTGNGGRQLGWIRRSRWGTLHRSRPLPRYRLRRRSRAETCSAPSSRSARWCRHRRCMFGCPVIPRDAFSVRLEFMLAMMALS